MKKLLAMFAICMAFSAPVAAEPILKQKPVQGAPPIEAINHYVLGSNLEAMFIAVVQVRTQMNTIIPVAVSFWVNPTTGEFIFVEGDKEEVCIIAVGEKIDFDVSNEELFELYLQRKSL